MSSHRQRTIRKAVCRAGLLITLCTIFPAAIANVASPADPGAQSNTGTRAVNSDTDVSGDETPTESKSTRASTDTDNTAAAISAAQPSGLRQTHALRHATITVEIDRREMGVADHLRFTLTVDAKSETDVEFEAVNDYFGSFKVIDHNPFGPIKLRNGSLRWQREYILAADAPGDLSIPTLTVGFYPPQQDCLTADACEMTAHGRRSDRREPRSADFEITTDAIAIQVTTILTADADLTRPRDVQPPVVLAAMTGGQQLPRSFVWVAALLAAGSALAFAARYRSRNRGVPVTPEPDEISARGRALEAISALRDERLPSSGQHQAHHVRLSYILRDYVSRAFGVSALEKTTAEIVTTLNQHPSLSSHSTVVSRLLGLSDLAKFARAYPDSTTSETMLDEIESIIEQTSPDENDAPG